MPQSVCLPPLPRDYPPSYWELASCGTGYGFRGDLQQKTQQELLEEGWEPFAVAEGRVWFRRARSNLPRTFARTARTEADPVAP